MTNIPVELDLELLQPGDDAPPFTLPSHTGDVVSLDDYRGRWLIIWWYLQAMGATCQACAVAWRKETTRLQILGVDLLGLSYTSPEQNAVFASMTDFAAPLLTADTDLARQYGAMRHDDEDWPMLPRRVAYIIDPDGIVRQRYYITTSSHYEIPRIVDDVAELVPARNSDILTPYFGKQPHQHGPARKFYHWLTSR